MNHEMILQWLDDLMKLAHAKAVEIGKEVGLPLAKDAGDFLAQQAVNLNRWGTFYAEGLLTAAEVESLVKGSGELFTLKALTAAGVAAVEAEKLRRDVLNAIAGLVGATLKNLTGGR
jgi:hypothetical protein